MERERLASAQRAEGARSAPPATTRSRSAVIAFSTGLPFWAETERARSLPSLPPRAERPAAPTSRSCRGARHLLGRACVAPRRRRRQDGAANPCGCPARRCRWRRSRRFPLRSRWGWRPRRCPPSGLGHGEGVPSCVREPKDDRSRLGGQQAVPQLELELDRGAPDQDAAQGGAGLEPLDTDTLIVDAGGIPDADPAHFLRSRGTRQEDGKDHDGQRSQGCLLSGNVRHR